MMRYFSCLLLTLLLLSGASCSPKQKMIRAMEKDKRAIKKMERKDLKRAYKSHKKASRAWYKQQPKEVQKRLKQQQRETNKFYKKYGKACTNTMPGVYHKPRNNYKKNGIK